MDINTWSENIRNLDPYVAIANDEVAGYADLQSNGYIDHFFIASDYARQGVGSPLMEYIFKEAILYSIDTLTSDVSKTAEPFFLRYGFHVIERRFPIRNGVMIENALMIKYFKKA